MITKSELKIIEKLEHEKEILQDLLDSFENKYVRSGIGLISYYDDFKQQPSENKDYAQIFQNMFKELITKFNEETKLTIQNRIKHIDVELEKYITKD